MNLTGEERIKKWLREKKWKMANFQKETLDAFIEGKSGILNAPTGSGKTYFPRQNKKDYKLSGLLH